ncbi:hypothetical protein B0H34DRAFT_801403 [Crassisporium funariophilum]|nr:hypothetical protein B0H34DRAFT_801403 [Crassisporium funariophilum]
MFAFTLFGLLLSLQLVSALPFNHTAGATSEISHVRHDTRSDEYLVYRSDGSIYGRFDSDSFKREVEVQSLESRASSSCHQMTLEQAKELHGWSKIEQYAKDTWGGGKWSIKVNPEGQRDSPATICVSNDVVQVKMTGKPVCNDNTAKISGKMTGTKGSVKLTFQQGYTSSASWTVTKSSAIAQSVSFSAEFSIPDVVKLGGSSTTTATFTNSLAKGFETSVNNVMTQEMLMEPVPGKSCVGTIKTQSCNVSGQGRIRLVADGFVWFNYDDKRAPKNDPKGAKHFKYAVNISNALKNLDDRSTWIDFTGSMKASVKSDYAAKCT